MEVHLNSGSLFSVPAAVADMLKLATHAQLKILLYVLCHADVTLTAGEISRACGVTEHEVEEALCFWQNARVLYNAPQTPAVQVQLQPVQQPAVPSVPAAEPAKPAAPRAAVPGSSSSSFRLRPDEIAKRKQESPVVAEMFTCAEQYAKRPLNYTEYNSLIWMHEYLGLMPEMILILIAYCADNGMFQVRTLEKIALEWQENHITTCELAEADIQRRLAQRSYTGQMMRIFGMAKPPTAAQQAVFDRWCALHMPPEMVRIAYDKMRDHISMDAGSKKQLSYMNGIIEKWAAAEIFTPQAAEQEDMQHRAQMQTSAQQPPKRRGAPQQSPKPGVKTSQSSIDLAEAEKLINQF